MLEVLSYTGHKSLMTLILYFFDRFNDLFDDIYDCTHFRHLAFNL